MNTDQQPCVRDHNGRPCDCLEPYRPPPLPLLPPPHLRPPPPTAETYVSSLAAASRRPSLSSAVSPGRKPTSPVIANLASAVSPQRPVPSSPVQHHRPSTPASRLSRPNSATHHTQHSPQHPPGSALSSARGSTTPHITRRRGSGSSSSSGRPLAAPHHPHVHRRSSVSSGSSGRPSVTHRSSHNHHHPSSSSSSSGHEPTVAQHNPDHRPPSAASHSSHRSAAKDHSPHVHHSRPSTSNSSSHGAHTAPHSSRRRSSVSSGSSDSSDSSGSSEEPPRSHRSHRSHDAASHRPRSPERVVHHSHLPSVSNRITSCDSSTESGSSYGHYTAPHISRPPERAVHRPYIPSNPKRTLSRDSSTESASFKGHYPFPRNSSPPERVVHHSHLPSVSNRIFPCDSSTESSPGSRPMSRSSSRTTDCGSDCTYIIPRHKLAHIPQLPAAHYPPTMTSTDSYTPSPRPYSSKPPSLGKSSPGTFTIRVENTRPPPPPHSPTFSNFSSNSSGSSMPYHESYMRHHGPVDNYYDDALVRYISDDHSDGSPHIHHGSRTSGSSSSSSIAGTPHGASISGSGSSHRSGRIIPHHSSSGTASPLAFKIPSGSGSSSGIHVVSFHSNRHQSHHGSISEESYSISIPSSHDHPSHHSEHELDIHGSRFPVPIKQPKGHRPARTADPCVMACCNGGGGGYRPSRSSSPNNPPHFSHMEFPAVLPRRISTEWEPRGRRTRHDPSPDPISTTGEDGSSLAREQNRTDAWDKGADINRQLVRREHECVLGKSGAMPIVRSSSGTRVVDVPGTNGEIKMMERFEEVTQEFESQQPCGGTTKESRRVRFTHKEYFSEAPCY